MKQTTPQEAFADAVARYKASIEHHFRERSALKRIYRSVRTFGFSYLLYTLARFRLMPLNSVRARLFFGKSLLLPAKDSGAHVLGMYGLEPHGSERKLTLWLMKHLGPEDTFFDVGAHFGFFTALAESCITEGKIYAFEANHVLCTYLKRNFGDNNRVIVVEGGIAGENGEIDFYDATDVTDSSMSSRFKVLDADIAPRTIPARTIDACAAEYKAAPTIIKLDIEGGEEDAIKGAKQTLESHTPTVIMEIWGGELGKRYSAGAVTSLQNMGYACFMLTALGERSTEEEHDPVSFISKASPDMRDNCIFIHSTNL